MVMPPGIHQYIKVNIIDEMIVPTQTNDQPSMDRTVSGFWRLLTLNRSWALLVFKTRIIRGNCWVDGCESLRTSPKCWGAKWFLCTTTGLIQIFAPKLVQEPSSRVTIHHWQRHFQKKSMRWFASQVFTSCLLITHFFHQSLGHRFPPCSVWPFLTQQCTLRLTKIWDWRNQPVERRVKTI